MSLDLESLLSARLGNLLLAERHATAIFAMPEEDEEEGDEDEDDDEDDDEDEDDGDEDEDEDE